MSEDRVMNVDLMTKVKAAILAEPERLDMVYLHSQEGEAVATAAEAISSCKTAHCIAGWGAVILNDVRVDGAGYGRASFGLSPQQGDELFWANAWPAPYRDQYRAASSQKERAAIAAARIDHMIEFGV